MVMNLKAFIFQFLKRHKIYLFVFLILIIFASLDASLAPYVLKLIIDSVNEYGSNPKLFINAIKIPAILYAAATIFHNLIMRGYGFVALKLFPKLRTEITTYLFNYLSLHSQDYFQQYFSGSLASRISDIAEGVENIIKIVNEMILGRIGAMIIALAILSTVHYIFALILIAWVIFYVGNGIRLVKYTKLHAQNYADAYSHLRGSIVDSVSNIISAKIFSNREHEGKRVEKAVSAVGVKDAKLQWHMLKNHMQQNVIYTLFIIGLLLSLIYGRVQGYVTIGDFAFVLTVSIVIAGMVGGLTQVMPTLSKEIGKCQQSLNVIMVPHQIKDIKDAKPIKIIEGLIEFKSVNFAYSKEKDLFQQLDLKIAPGTKVGLVGYSGGGKSTFVNLILRLYQIQKGEILIDKQNINNVTRKSLRSQIAMIPQQPDLFHRTIMDNIRYGDINASDEDVFIAAKSAQCHEFIEKLNNSYQTMVGEKGIKLSGGQRQRIAIARAILKNAPILILDEATSALDSVTEHEIHDSLMKVMSNRTTLVIAHRLSTLLEMDRILFFKDGAIIEDGTLEELRAKKHGHFARIWNMQADGYIQTASCK